MWLRLEAAAGDDPERVAIREGLAFGKALHELLRLPLVAERGQPTRVRPRVEASFCMRVGSIPIKASGRADLDVLCRSNRAAPSFPGYRSGVSQFVTGGRPSMC